LAGAGAAAGGGRVNEKLPRATLERRAHDARMVTADFDQAPFTIAWEVTRACAFVCRHCRAEAQPRRHPDELTSEEALRLIDQIKEIGDPILVITGGDPMMRRDLYDILAYAVEKGLRTSLTPTTTRLASAKALARVKDAGVRRVALSIDGPTPESHDAFRGFSGSFEIAKRIAKDIVSVGLSLQINTTVSRYNLELLEEMTQMVADMAAVQWSVFFLVPTGRGKADDMISALEHERVFHWLYDLSEQAPFDIKSTAAPAYRRVVIERERDKGRPSVAPGEMPRTLAGAGYRYQDGLNRPAQGVNDGKGFCFVSHTGDVCPSGFLPLPGGNIRQQSLTDVYRDSSLFRDLRQPDKLKGKCGRCEFRQVCGGSRARAYALTGDYLATDPSCAYDPGKDG
jgi:radical SAM protein